MKPFDALRWAFSCLVVTAVVAACGSDNNDAPAAGASSGGSAPNATDRDPCATPNEHCPCTGLGTTVACGHTVDISDGFVLCGEGHRTCDGQHWGGCDLEGNLTTKSISALLSGGLRTSNISGTSTTCGLADACDPYCSVYVDTPSGITSDSGLGATDAGLTVVGDATTSVPTSVLTTPTGDQTCGVANAHAGTCVTSGVIDYTKCQQDYRCDTVGNSCVWNGAAGYFDSTAGFPDLQVGASCAYSSFNVIPVCNRGSVAVVAGTSIGLNFVSAVPTTCASIGPSTCSAPAPAGGLLPGQCMNITGCTFGTSQYAVVNAGNRDANEGATRCLNNAAPAPNPQGTGCAACTTCDTRIKGTVYAPDQATPLPGISVYEPAGPLPVFTTGVACDTCASLTPATAAGTTSASDGTFTIYSAVPGAHQDLVVQTGRWRRKVTVPITACTTNTITAANTRLPKNHGEGDIPKTAFVEGSREALECTLLKFGLDSTEFAKRTASTDTNRIQFWRGTTATGSDTGMSTATGLAPIASGLFSTPATLAEYNQLVMGCGIEYKADQIGSTNIPAASKTNYSTWLNNGGRAFLDHWSGEAFIHQTPGIANTATWASPLPSGALGTARGKVNTTTAPQTQMRDWLLSVGGSTDWGAGWMRSDEPWEHAINPGAGTTEWVRGLSTYSAFGGTQWTGTPAGNFNLSYSFDTPYPPATGSCAPGSGGRVIYNGMHVAHSRISHGSDTYPASTDIFPAACQNGPGLTSEELSLMYLFFQLSACTLGGAPPPTVPPPTSLPTGLVYTRDYSATCPPGTLLKWQKFEWQATVPTGTSIAFRAATAATVAALPAAPPPGAPSTAGIGTATLDTPTVDGGLVWDADASTVDAHLKAEEGTSSQANLRVYMTFNTTGALAPTLIQWQQLYDCIPNE